MSNADKIILDLCGGTGAWSKPYKDAGYDVRLCTLPDCDVRTYEPLANVYGILAAPPCTMFSLARQTAKTPRDLKGAMEIVGACVRIIWQCRAQGTLKFWALENPRGYLRQFLGKPAMTFEPWQFGDKTKKRTDLWGYFNAPRKKVGAKKPVRYQWEHIKAKEGLSRTEVRAITPPKFARSFYKANNLPSFQRAPRY